MLKLIPQEHAGGENRKKTKKKTHFVHLELKLRELEKSDHRLFAVAGKQLMEYVKKAENISLKELNDLIHNLQRSVIGLQKKRIRIVRKSQRKKKDGNG